MLRKVLLRICTRLKPHFRELAEWQIESSNPRALVRTPGAGGRAKGHVLKTGGQTAAYYVFDLQNKQTKASRGLVKLYNLKQYQGY